ncbi:TPA: hypothetical protein ACH3X1_002206 [Trebouxia sp. C0004]
MYATEYYDRFFGSTADEKRQLYKHVATQTTKTLRSIQVSFGIAVNSASVERLFSAFGNIQTKRRSRFVHARVQKLATIKSMLPVKPRPKKKLAGNQYLGGRTRRSVTLDKESATAEATQAKAESERQFMDDSSDMLLDAGQVDVIIQEYQ